MTSLQFIRSRITYANVMSTLAVMLALGGTAYAAATVGTRQVVDNSLTSADVRNGSLTSLDVKDRSLLARDFKAGQLPRGATGAAGAPGAKGDKGDPSFVRTFVVSPTADLATSGDRVRAAVAAAAAFASANSLTNDDQVLVLLEPGRYRVSSTIELPGSVSLAGSGRGVTNVGALAGAFTGTALVRFLDTTSGDGDRWLRDLTLTRFDSGVMGDFSMVEIVGSDIEIEGVDVDTSMGATGALRGVHVTGDAGRVELVSTDLNVSNPTGTGFGVDDRNANSGAFITIRNGILRAEGAAGSAVIRTTAATGGGGAVNVYGGLLAGSSSALAVSALNNSDVRVLGTQVEGGGGVLSSTTSAAISLVNGTFARGATGPVAVTGTVECLGMFRGLGSSGVLPITAICT